jgi:hypothetical protein
MYNSPFTPFGPTYLVGTSVVQVSSRNNDNPTSYRVRNTTASVQYLSWVPDAPGNPTPTITVTAPTAGSPSASTLGFLPSSVEVIGGIPPNAWFKADAVGAFEVTAGEGL